MAVKIITYLNDEVTQELLDEYSEVNQDDAVKKLDEEERNLQQDQFEPGRIDLVGLVVARDADHLIGGIKLFSRRCVFGEQKFQLGGIGGVFTLRQNQRQGVATLMLGKAMLALDVLKADVVYLCTDISKLERLYWPFGFRHIVQGHTYLGKSGKRYTEYDGMLAMVSSWEIFSHLMTSDTPIDIGEGNW